MMDAHELEGLTHLLRRARDLIDPDFASPLEPGKCTRSTQSLRRPMKSALPSRGIFAGGSYENGVITGSEPSTFWKLTATDVSLADRLAGALHPSPSARG